MDRRWTRETNTLSESFINGVQSFFKFTIENLKPQEDSILCPCGSCNNTRHKTFAEVKDDLKQHGFSYSYTKWIFHGEDVKKHPCDSDDDVEDNSNMEPDLNDGLDDMLDDLAQVQQGSGETESFVKLCMNATRELYPGCSKTLLSVVTKLLHIKVQNLWSNKSFEMLLKLLNDILPEGHTLPTSYYATKKILDEMGMGYDEIEVCKNDCALFYKENKGKEKCPICDESRWKSDDGKGNRTPHKILRHFPLKPRLQRLFMSSEVASDMRWHKEERVEEKDVMKHPADTPAWKHFDALYSEFAEDSRNVKLGLASDGFTPWSDLGNSYSMWPVLLIPYNLPSYKFMKEEFHIVSLLIPGPRSPGKDIDVYLRPLIDELKELWEVGIETYDVYGKERFQMRASLLWTISDFPAYGSLSGWVTMGKMACPCCFDETRSVQLRSKTAFMGHRCFLDKDHSWRKNKSAFNGQEEHREEPHDLSGEQVFNWLHCIHHLFGEPGKNPAIKKRKRTPEQANWVKMSIFFELPYWKYLLIRHILDVMHIEKNICDNIIAILLDIKGKTKDTEKAREDLRDWGIRKELHLMVRASDNKAIKPVACYKLSPTEKAGFCEFLKSVKSPDGFAANISRCIKEKKICGLKSHDCHVLLQRLIPAGIRGYLNKEVNDALYELGDFFKELCSKTLTVENIKKLAKNIPLILCKLEKIFPPAFFTVMVHLAVHLPEQARIAGPVQPRWMYPIERNLGSLKHFVRNRARPEASIAEQINLKEILTFASMYLSGIETKFNQRPRNHDGISDGDDVENLSVFSMRARPFVRVTRKSINPSLFLSDEDLNKAHLFVLRNCDEVQKYMSIYKAEIMGLTIEEVSNLEVNDAEMKKFPEWFRKHIDDLHENKVAEVTESLWALANGPFKLLTKYYKGCMVNEVRFHTKDHEVHRTTQNSGLVAEGEHKGSMMDFFGFLSNVVELTYLGSRTVVLFQCEWYDTGNRTGKRKTIQEDKHFLSIDVRSRWYKHDPFVLPIHVNQVFYVNDTKLGNNWKIVQRVQHRHLWDLPSGELEDDDSKHSHTQTPMQQFESVGVNVVRDDDDHAVPNSLVRKDLEPDEIDVQEFISLRQAKVLQVDDDEENQPDLELREDSDHYLDGYDIMDFDKSNTCENEEMMGLSESEEEDYEAPRIKRRCKCHL